MTAAAPTALIQRPGNERKGKGALPPPLCLKGGSTVLEDAHGIVLQDSHRPNRPAYFADLTGVLHEVFKRQVNRRLVQDQWKDLAALRDAIEETREEFVEILSQKGRP